LYTLKLLKTGAGSTLHAQDDTIVHPLWKGLLPPKETGDILYHFQQARFAGKNNAGRNVPELQFMVRRIGEIEIRIPIGIGMHKVAPA